MDEESRKYWAGAEVIWGSDGDGEGQDITRVEDSWGVCLSINIRIIGVGLGGRAAHL